MLNLATVTRAELLAVFKTDKLARLVEDMLRAITVTLPGAADGVQANLDAHIADTADAHQASAIGFAPAGGMASNTVQAGMLELNTSKVPTTRSVNGHALSADVTLNASDVGLGSVTNDAQTKSAIVPNAVPGAGQILVGNAGGTAYGAVGMSGDGALSSAGALTVSKIGGKSVTLAGNLTTAGAFASTFTFTGITTVTYPTSGTLATLAGTETLSGKTLATPITTGTAYAEQGAQTTKAGVATLTIAELLTGIIEYTGAAAALTLPTGANIDAGVLAGLANDRAFDFVIVNTGSGTATVTTNTGLTLTGAMTVAAGVSAQFRARKTAASTFTVYRIA